MVLGEDGLVYSFGYNKSGQLGAPTTSDIVRTPVIAQGLNKVISISVGAGGNSTKAVRYDGTVWGWGDNGAGQINNTNIPSYNYPKKIDLGEFNGHVVRTYDGLYHVAALLDNGRIITWGRNGVGQLGQGSVDSDNMQYHAPEYVDVFDGSDNYYVVGLSVGATHNLAITSDGSVYSWGDNGQGRLGVKTVTEPQGSPIRVTVDNDEHPAMAVATGGSSSYVVLDDGFVWSFGMNLNGQLGNSYAGEDPVYNVNNSVNSEDANMRYPVLVTGRNLKLKPESLILYLGDDPYQMEVSFNRFNLISDDAVSGSTYSWKIENELDADGNAPSIIGSVVSVDANGKVKGKKLGTAELVVTDSKTKITQKANIEIVDPGKIHLDKLVFDFSVLDKTVLKDAIEKGYLDDDEYIESTSELGNLVYSLVDPLSGIYTGLVKTLTDNATTVTVRVKSKVTGDVISMINKDGSPALKADNVTPITGKLLTAENLEIQILSL